MAKKVSQESLNTFFILLIIYALITAGLIGLNALGICKFQTDLTSVEKLIFSLPMVSLYLLLFLAATAGYAQGKEMLEKLPLSTRLKNELNDRSLESAGIKTKIRAGSQISLDDCFTDVVNNMISSRIPILAILNKNAEVQGVMTATDLLSYMQGLLKGDELNILKLKTTNVADILEALNKTASEASSVKADDKLTAVTETMIKHQYSKLIVTEDGKRFSGTIDALDVLAELLDKKIC